MRPEDYLFVNLHSLSHPATPCITCRIVLRGRNLSDAAHYVRESTSPQIETQIKDLAYKTYEQPLRVHVF